MTIRAHDAAIARPRPVVGVLCCSRQHPDGLIFHRVYEQYVNALAVHARVLPVLVPLVRCGHDGELDDLSAQSDDSLRARAISALGRLALSACGMPASPRCSSTSSAAGWT